MTLTREETTMTQIDNQSVTGKPGILELLSELEKRDERSHDKTTTHTDNRSELHDPRGCKVMNTTGHDVGKVVDLYVDPNSRAPQFAVLQLGNNPLGIGDRRILVSFSDIEITAAGEARVKVAV